MRRLISVGMSIVFFLMVLFSVIRNYEVLNAEEVVVVENTECDKVESSCIITGRLLEYMERTRNTTIPVTVQIRDEIDLEAIEEQVMKNVNLTLEDLQQMEEYGNTLSEEENIEYQKNVMVVYDAIRAERNRLLKEYYSEVNGKFIESMKWTEDDYESVGMFAPFVRGINMTADEIYQLANTGLVDMIDYTMHMESIEPEIQVAQTRAAVPLSESTAIIGGNVAVDKGFKGADVKVGIVEKHYPRLTDIKEEYRNDITLVSKVNGATGTFGDHAIVTCTILKTMAPECSIYSYSAHNEGSGIPGCEKLINEYNVQVINMSYGETIDGNYNAESCELDIISRNNKVSIVVAAGNYNTYNASENDDINYVSTYAIAPNVIAVGAVGTYGTDKTASNAYTMGSLSCYNEQVGTINKPDLSAPGNVSVEKVESVNAAYTSYATSHVTGTVIQMLSRNPSKASEPTAVKATLLASATYGTRTRGQTLYGNTEFDSKEGAGVVDAEFCYNVASSGRLRCYEMPYNEATYSFGANCTSTTKPLRIAIAWDVISDKDNETVVYNDYDITIYRNGIPIEASCTINQGESGTNTNYEIAQLDVSKLAYFGTGTYEVRVTRNGNAQSTYQHNLGWAWGQP